MRKYAKKHNKLIDSMNNGLIKVVTGIRRCRKSFLLFNLFDEYLKDNNIDNNHIIKIALDDRANKKLRDSIKVMYDEYGITSIGIVEFLSNIYSMDL